MRRLWTVVAIGIAALAMPRPTLADEDLGDLLVKKGVITQEELERLRAGQHHAAPPPAPPAPPETPRTTETSAAGPTLKDQVKAIGQSGGKIKFGGVDVTLGGFIEMATIYRTRNEVADVGSDFNTGIPFENDPKYHENETRFSARQSRLSLLAEGNVDSDTKLSGYYEMDWLSAAASSNSRESNSYSLRSRQLYATLDRNDWGFHLLTGQAWSLLTTNTSGIIPRKEQIPLTIDAQYVEGFNWTRNPQVRLVEDFCNGLWLGLSVESPEAVTSPIISPKSVNSTNAGGSLLNGTTSYSTDDIPDVVTKLALDPGFGHWEVKGLMRWFTARVGTSNDTTIGYGVGGAGTIPVIPGFLEAQASGLYGPGIGRYGSGQLPDFAFDAKNKPEAIQEAQALGGLIAHPWIGNDLYIYYGYEHADRTGADSVSGYGAPSLVTSGCFVEGGGCTVTAPVPASDNPPTPAKSAIGAETEELQQVTGGFWQDIYKGSYGRYVFGFEGGEIWRDAFPGVGGRPKTNIGIFMTSFRYYPFS